MRNVFGCYLTSGEGVEHSFLVSLAALMSNDQHLATPGMVRRRTGPGNLADARNDLTIHFLENTSAEWMWMVDSDMGFAPDILDCLLSAADANDRPVMGALCFASDMGEPDGMGGYSTFPVPTLYGWDGEGFRRVVAYPKNTLVKTAGTGAACLLIHRSVIEELKIKYGQEWWTPVRYPDGRYLGEDLSFSYRVGACNLPIYVDTSIPTTHAKTIWWSEKHFDLFSGLSGAPA